MKRLLFALGLLAVLYLLTRKTAPLYRDAKPNWSYTEAWRYN